MDRIIFSFSFRFFLSFSLFLSLSSEGEEGARLLTASCLALSISLRSHSSSSSSSREPWRTLAEEPRRLRSTSTIVVERRCDRPHCRVPAPRRRGQGRPGKRGGFYLVLASDPSSPLRGRQRERERARTGEQQNREKEEATKSSMVIFFSIDGLSTFVSPFSLASTSSSSPSFPLSTSTHRTRRVCLTREVRLEEEPDFRAGKKEEENSKTAASPFFSSSFLSFNLHLSLPPLASFGTAPSFAPSSITSSSANPFSAASSTATAQSDFARSAAAVGAGIHTTSERLKALAALARRTSSFDDPAAEIADLSARIKRDIAGLNGALSELAAVGARSRAAAAASSAASSAAAQQQQHSATVVDGLRLRLRDAASQFRDVLDARQKSRWRPTRTGGRGFPRPRGPRPLPRRTGAGAAAAERGRRGRPRRHPFPRLGEGVFPGPEASAPLRAQAAAEATDGGSLGGQRRARLGGVCRDDNDSKQQQQKSAFHDSLNSPLPPLPPPPSLPPPPLPRFPSPRLLGTAQPFLRQRGGMARYGGGGGGGGLAVAMVRTAAEREKDEEEEERGKRENFLDDEKKKPLPAHPPPPF